MLNSNTALWAVILFQCSLLILLTLRLSSIEAGIASNAPVIAEENSNAYASPGMTSAVVGALDKNDIRMIVRSELIAVMDRLDTLENVQLSASAPTTNAPRIELSEEEAAQRLNEFNTTFNNAVASGAVSAAQIADIEQKIARLPPSERKRALSMLSRALTDGSIDAPL